MCYHQNNDNYKNKQNENWDSVRVLLSPMSCQDSNQSPCETWVDHVDGSYELIQDCVPQSKVTQHLQSE